MKYANSEKTLIVLNNGTTIPCDDDNAAYHAIKYGVGQVGQVDYIAPTIDNVTPFEASVIADEVIIAAGVNEITHTLDLAYTTNVAKNAEYMSKKLEAKYVLAQATSAELDIEECPLLTAEAPEQSITVRQLATIVMAKVKGFEALVAAARIAKANIAADVAAAETQTAKLEAKDAVVNGFKALVAGE